MTLCLARLGVREAFDGSGQSRQVSRKNTSRITRKVKNAIFWSKNHIKSTEITGGTQFNGDQGSEYIISGSMATVFVYPSIYAIDYLFRFSLPNLLKLKTNIV